MKNFMRKLSAIGISLTLLFGNFLPFYTTVQPLQAETTLDSNTLGGFIILWLAGMGITINSKGPNLNGWVNDEFEKWKKLNYDSVDLDKLAERQQEQKLSYDKAFLKIGSDLYNAYSGFASYLQKTFSINFSSSNVVVGNITTENYFVPIYSESRNQYRIENINFGDTFFNYVYFANGTVNSRWTVCRVNNEYYIVAVTDSGVSFSGSCGYDSPTLGFFGTTTIHDELNGYRIYFNGRFSSNVDLPNFDEIHSVSLLTWIVNRTYGDFALDDRQVLADGNVKLDDRVITTSKDATLDLSKLVSMDGLTTTDQVMDILKQWTLDNSYPADYPMADAEASTDVPSDVPSDIANGKIEGLQTVFPFCVPYDIKEFFNVLVADPVAPKWTFHLDYYDMKYDLTLNLADFESVFVVFRYGMLGLFILGLILITREIVGGE